jgi:hypothetical protein
VNYLACSTHEQLVLLVPALERIRAVILIDIDGSLRKADVVWLAIRFGAYLHSLSVSSVHEKADAESEPPFSQGFEGRENQWRMRRGELVPACRQGY